MYNSATLIGRVGKDPELKYTPAGQPVAQFSLATSEKYTDKSGNKQEKTEWHNIVIWGKLAEIANQYVKKGSLLLVTGKITTRSWDDQSGQKKYKTEIVCSEMKMLGGKTESTGSQSSGQWGQSEPSEPANEDDLPF